MQIEEAIEIMNNFLKDTPKLPYECLMNKEVEAVETILSALHKANKEKHNQKNLRRFNERKYRKAAAVANLQDRILRLMIKDFQAEAYFKDMKYEQIIEYYKRRKDLKE